MKAFDYRGVRKLVAGIDGCRGGWVMAIAGNKRPRGRIGKARLVESESSGR